jgi:hypothetical protein
LNTPCATSPFTPTGPFQTVERVFRMLMKAIRFGTVLMMIDGRLKAVKEGERE